MRHFCVLGLAALLLSAWAATAAHAQSASAGCASSGRSRTGFACSATRPTSSATSPPIATTACSAPRTGSSVESDGRGWARDTVERLCVDRAGKLMETCDRDGVRESYLAPRDHRIGVVLGGRGAGRPVLRLELRRRQRRAAPVDHPLRRRGEAARRLRTADDRERRRRAAGRHRATRRHRHRRARRADRRHGRLDRRRRRQSRPAGAALRRRLLLPALPRRQRSEYYRPGRDGFTGNKSCAARPRDDAGAGNWARQSARWESGPCHRSLYSYQTAHRARAGGREPASGRHLPAARLLRRHRSRSAFSATRASANAQAPAPTRPVPEQPARRSPS